MSVSWRFRVRRDTPVGAGAPLNASSVWFLSKRALVGTCQYRATRNFFGASPLSGDIDV